MTQFEAETMQGYEPPMNTQFSVFLHNRVGKLLELLEIFGGSPVKVAGLSVIEAADHAVVRLVTSNAMLMRKLLKARKLPASEADILVVQLGPQHQLSNICSMLLAAEVNIHYLYPLLVWPQQQPAIALYTDDQVLAGGILLRKKFVLLGENDLGDDADGGGQGGQGGPDDDDPFDLRRN